MRARGNWFWIGSLPHPSHLCFEPKREKPRASPMSTIVCLEKKRINLFHGYLLPDLRGKTCLAVYMIFYIEIFPLSYDDGTVCGRNVGW